MREDGMSSEQVKHMLGIPGVHGTNAMVSLYISEKVPMYEKMKEATLLWRSQAGWQTINEHVRQTRVSKMYHSTVKRLELSCPMLLTLATLAPDLQTKENIDTNHLTPTCAMFKILQVLKQQQGFRALQGLAPMGDLERRVQDYLDSQEKK